MRLFTDTDTERSRGVTPALTYVLAIGIVTVLISGLLIAGTDFVETERTGVVRSELEVVGERLAADAVTVDRLTEGGASVSQRTRIPESVADAPYYVDLVDCPSGNACIELTSADPGIDASVEVPVDNRTPIAVSRSSSRSIRISASSTGDPSPTADADLRVNANIGVGDGVDRGDTTGGSVFEADTAPVVSGFSYTPSSPAMGESITLTSDVVQVVEGNYTYRWDLDGDGVADRVGNESTASTVSYTYTTPGRYDATLTVEGPNNQSDSVSRLVRVSGLVLESETESNTDGDGPTAGLKLDVRNNFPSEDVTISDIAVRPADPSVDSLYNPDGPEVEIGGDSAYNDNADIYSDGRIVVLENRQTIPAGTTSEIKVGEFYTGSISDDSNQFATTGEEFEVTVRYETDDRRNYAPSFVIGGIGGTASQQPSIANVTVDCTGPGANGDFTSAEITVSDPNNNLNEVSIVAYDDTGVQILQSGTISYPSSGGTETYFGPDDTRELKITASDDTGLSDSQTTFVCGGSP